MSKFQTYGERKNVKFEEKNGKKYKKITFREKFGNKLSAFL